MKPKLIPLMIKALFKIDRPEIPLVINTYNDMIELKESEKYIDSMSKWYNGMEEFDVTHSDCDDEHYVRVSP